MKRILFTGTIFVLSTLLGVGFSLTVTPDAQADDCEETQLFIWYSCDTGVNCKYAGQWYMYGCEGFYVGTTIPCNCTWIDCHDDDWRCE